MSKEIKIEKEFVCKVRVKVSWRPGDPYASVQIDDELLDGIGIPVEAGGEAESCHAAVQVIQEALNRGGLDDYYSYLPQEWE